MRDACPKSRINAFLWFGYQPDSYPQALSPLTGQPEVFAELKAELARLDHRGIARQGEEALRRIFEASVEDAPGLQILPLSGGFDSRLILALLLEAGMRDRIVAVTYGIPGALDYEIAQEVARAAGVCHHLVNLNDIPVDESALIYARDRGAKWTELITAYYNRMIFKRYGAGNTCWSGFLGDPLAGSHYHEGDEAKSWADSKEAFANRNSWLGNSRINLCEATFVPSSALPDTPYIADPSWVSFPEQLDFCIRQMSWIRKVLVDEKHDVRTPLAEDDWIRFSLAVPAELRKGCSLYQQILFALSPDLFSIRAKSALAGLKPAGYNSTFLGRAGRRLIRRGSRLRRRDPGLSKKAMLNYIEFEEGFRSRADLVTLARDSLEWIRMNGIADWLDTRGWADRPSNLEEGWGSALQLLVSLRFNCEG